MYFIPKPKADDTNCHILRLRPVKLSTFFPTFPDFFCNFFCVLPMVQNLLGDRGVPPTDPESIYAMLVVRGLLPGVHAAVKPGGHTYPI